jgi:diacylglycerol kinase
MHWIKKRLNSFGCAFNGLWTLFRTETHAQIHLLAVVVVGIAGFFTGLGRWEWLVVILTITLVLALEGMNTALEALADAIHPEHHPLIGKAKDVAAGAVLMSAIGALVVAVVVFLPHWM